MEIIEIGLFKEELDTLNEGGIISLFESEDRDIIIKVRGIK